MRQSTNHPFSRQFLLQTAEDLEMILLNIKLNQRETNAFVKVTERLKKEADDVR